MDIDLRQLEDSSFVLHFGGRPNQIDAFTFSNSLVAFSEAIQAINAQINDGFSVDVIIEGLGEGSFQAKIATKLKALASLFKTDARNLLINLLASYIFVQTLDPSKPPEIHVTEDQVVITVGSDRIIMSKEAWNARSAVKNPEVVQKKVAKAFEVMDEDTSVTEFGFARHLHDKPIAVVPRDKFALLAREPEPEESEDKRHEDKEAELTIVKVVFEKGSRKWQFVWNGNKISAPIRDENFVSDVFLGLTSFSQGDVLIVTLRVYQVRDMATGAYINDHYEIIKVHDHRKRDVQTGLFH